MIKHAGEVIQTGTFDRPQSSVKTCTVAFELFVKQAREARINSEFPIFGLELFKQAMAAGYGEEEVAALIKVLRGAPNPALTRQPRAGQRLNGRVVRRELEDALRF